jgi:FMN phosphatase YigB (HAD superfamily)
VAVSFDLFGTLVVADRPAAPAAAVARELRARDVAVPDDWADAYREAHLPVAAGAEIPTAEHAHAALTSRGVDAPAETVAAAVRAAFTAGAVRTREGAPAAVRAAAERGPVGVCSNCSVRGLVAWAIEHSALDAATFDAVVTSVDCGWRKPDERAFAAVADAMGTPVDALVHVGDDPATDGGIEDAGGTFLDVRAVSLTDLPARLDREGRA